MEEYTVSQPVQPQPVTEPAVPGHILEAFRGTQPWVRFIAVMGFILTALIILVSLGMMVMGLVGEEIFGTSRLEGVFISLIYSLSGLFYAIPTYFLWNYGTAIQKLLKTPAAGLLTDAIDAQRRFWKVIGIFTLIWLILCSVILIIGLIVFAVAMTMAA